MPVHHIPQPLKTPLLCWHESLSSARNDALVALSTDSARIATTRPLPTGTAVYLELEGGAGIDAVATALDQTGFIVEFVTVDDAAAVLIERALRDNADDRAPQPFERSVSRPAAILSPPTAPDEVGFNVERQERQVEGEASLVDPVQVAANDVVTVPPSAASWASEAPSFGAAAATAAVVAFSPEPVAEAVAEPRAEPTLALKPVADDIEHLGHSDDAAPSFAFDGPPAAPPAVVEPVVADVEPAAPMLAFAAFEPAAPTPVLQRMPDAEPVAPVAPIAAFAATAVVEHSGHAEAPAAPSSVSSPVDAMQHDEVSIADALRFELDDDDDAVAAPVLPATVVPVPFSEPAVNTPAPAPIVEPFDDLHSDDLVDAAFAHYQPAPTADQPDFEQTFGVPRAEQAAFDAAAEAAFLANDDVGTDVASEVPRTRTDELFALPAASSLEPAPAPAALSRTPTASLFDMPHTVPMGSLPVPPPNATQDLLLSPGALSAEAWAAAMAPPPATIAPVVEVAAPAKETTDKWPLARAITAEPESFSSSAAPEVTAPGAHAFALPITTNGVVLDGLESTPSVTAAAEDAGESDDTWARIAQQVVDDDDDDTHIDPITAPSIEATAPAVAAPVNDVASDDLAEGFDVAFTNPGVFALEPMPTAESTFAPPPSTGEHAIDLELDDDEIELDHRPNLVLEPVDDHVEENFDNDFDNDDSEDHDHVEALVASVLPAVPGPGGAERVPSRPLPTLDPEPAPDEPRVVDVDFSEFRDVLGATRRVYDALLPSLLPRPPSEVPPVPPVQPVQPVAPPAMSVPNPLPTTAATLGLPQPPPSLLTPPEPRQAADAPFALPRPPGSRTAAALGFGAAGNPFGGDSERQRFGDSVPPAVPSLPNDEPWTVSSPPSPAFPAPRLLDADLGPVLTAGNSSAPRGLPFVGDSGAQAPTTQATVSPLTPSTPDDLPLVVGDQVVLSAEDLVDDDWQIGPGPGRR